MEEPGGPRPTTEELQSLTVVKLRQRLAQYGIPQSGKIIQLNTALPFLISNNKYNLSKYISDMNNN